MPGAQLLTEIPVSALSRMNNDLTDLLKEWPYEPGHILARLVKGSDGEDLLQLRVDLGILQMKLDGRPDGERPNGFESYLEHFEDQAAAHMIDPDSGADALADEGPLAGEEPPAGSAADRNAPRFLTPDDCRLLRDEAVQYYHRYVALLAVEDFDRVIRDTTRNLRLLDFCAAHAIAEPDRVALEQFRPYVTMIRARAAAGLALRDNEPRAALVAIDEGLDALHRIFDDHTPEQFEASGEVRALRAMRDALLPKLPVSQTSELSARLAKAIEDENYELAAILRDEIRQLKD